MQQTGNIHESPNLGSIEPASQHGSFAVMRKVMTTVANFFREKALWCVEISLWMRDGARSWVIDLFPERSETLQALIPENPDEYERQLIVKEVVKAWKAVPKSEREEVGINAA